VAAVSRRLASIAECVTVGKNNLVIGQLMMLPTHCSSPALACPIVRCDRNRCSCNFVDVLNYGLMRLQLFTTAEDERAIGESSCINTFRPIRSLTE
jgi:hypothetical protein